MYKRVYIEITNICNLNCSFCPNTKRDKKYMSIDEYEIIIKKIKDYTDNVYLHVKGEPLMHPYLDEILKISNKYNINVNITTNGRCLKEKIGILNNNKIRQINISLHSFNDINEIKELLDNIDEIKNTYISLRLWNNSDNKEVIELLENHYNTKIDINNKRSVLFDNIFLSNDILFNWPNINGNVISNVGTCLALKSQIGVLVDGTIVACCLDHEGYNNLGNIFDNSMEEIINSEKYKSILKGFNDNKLVSELCTKCGYRTRFDRGSD